MRQRRLLLYKYFTLNFFLQGCTQCQEFDFIIGPKDTAHPVFCMHFRSKTAPFLLFSVCKALKSGMAGLFGPQSSVTSSHVQSICDTLEIPHIETRWDYRMKRDDYSVNLYPHPFALGQVCQMPSTLRGKIYSKCPGH